MIVFCHLLNDNSGSPVVLREAIAGLGAHNMDRMLFVGHGGRGILETAGVPIRRYWYRRSRVRLLTLFTYLVSQLALYRALSQAGLPKNAVIYVNTLLPFGAALWGRRSGRTVVYHLHEVSLSPRLLQKLLVRVAELTACKIVYVSEDHQRRLPIAPVPSSVVPNPVPASLAEHAFATPYAPRRSGRFEVLMLASPRDFKGVPEFLDLARALLYREDLRFTLVLNAVEDEIEAYCPRSSLPANLILHPRTDDPATFYATADMVLNLSRVDQWIETFGMTILEALAFGVPVLVPPLGGPAEIVTDGQEGYLVDSRDPSLLAKRVTDLADDAAKARAMSEAAGKRAKDFSAAHFAAALHAAISIDRRPTETSPEGARS